MRDPAAWGFGARIKTLIRERPACYEMSQRASNFDEFSGTSYATENGMDSSRSEQRSMEGSCEQGTETPDSMKWRGIY
jgi:hypothetical protein